MRSHQTDAAIAPDCRAHQAACILRNSLSLNLGRLYVPPIWLKSEATVSPLSPSPQDRASDRPRRCPDLSHSAECLQMGQALLHLREDVVCGAVENASQGTYLCCRQCLAHEIEYRCPVHNRALIQKTHGAESSELSKLTKMRGNRSLIGCDNMQPCAQGFPDVSCRRLSAQIEDAHFEENVRAALAHKVQR